MKLFLIVMIFFVVLNGKQNSYKETYTWFDDISSKEEVNCNKFNNKNTLVLLVAGQSNAGNHGKGKYSSNNSFELYNDICYKGSDPMLGTTGDGGSPWHRLSDKFIKRTTKYKNILYINISMGGSHIKQWSQKGILYQRIIDSISMLHKHDLKVDYFLFHQGETDRHLHTTTKDYLEDFLNMIDGLRSLKNSSQLPVVLAIATRCQSDIDINIQNAQYEIINLRENTYLGPNTDDIYSVEDRIGMCHMSEIGLKKHSNAWLNILLNLEKKGIK